MDDDGQAILPSPRGHCRRFLIIFNIPAAKIGSSHHAEGLVNQKNWLKLAKIDQFSNFFGYFHIFQVVEHTRAETVLERVQSKNET
jgi:hypothetical protein